MLLRMWVVFVCLSVCLCVCLCVSWQCEASRMGSKMLLDYLSLSTKYHRANGPKESLPMRYKGWVNDPLRKEAIQRIACSLALLGVIFMVVY